MTALEQVLSLSLLALGVGGFPTLSNVLDRIDLGERYSTSVCKAENLDASRLCPSTVSEFSALESDGRSVCGLGVGLIQPRMCVWG